MPKKLVAVDTAVAESKARRVLKLFELGCIRMIMLKIKMLRVSELIYTTRWRSSFCKLKREVNVIRPLKTKANNIPDIKLRVFDKVFVKSKTRVKNQNNPQSIETATRPPAMNLINCASSFIGLQ
jgi:hypothetical protein